MEYLHNKLAGYEWIETLNQLRLGSYLRWIRLDEPEKVHRGGTLCDVQFNQDGILLMCKGFNHRHFAVKAEECLVFQKSRSRMDQRAERVVVQGSGRLLRTLPDAHSTV